MSRRDAALALAVLVPVVWAGAALGAPLDPVAAAVGAAGALLLELALTRRRTAVRRVWERPAVQAGCVAGALAGAAVLVRAAGPLVLTVLAGGLVAYLAVLVALAAQDSI
ncbi:MAG: hypothetical protein ABEJ43_04140 [Haloferacaceae archaeon]